MVHHMPLGVVQPQRPVFFQQHPGVGPGVAVAIADVEGQICRRMLGIGRQQEGTGQLPGAGFLLFFIEGLV